MLLVDTNVLVDVLHNDCGDDAIANSGAALDVDLEGEVKLE